MKIGIDLGTANILVYVQGKGIVIQEPSVVAVDDQNRIVAVGEDAREMIGRTPGNISAIRPMKDGVIADYVITEALLSHFISKVKRGSIGFRRPDVMISVPAGVTSVEKRAVRDAALKAGAGAAYLIEEPLAAAIGANVPIAGPSGNMVIDIGGGTSEIAVIALGGIVVSTSLRVGGNKFDEAISTYIRKKYNLMVGDRTAEEVKIQIGTALPLERELYNGKSQLFSRDAFIRVSVGAGQLRGMPPPDAQPWTGQLSARNLTAMRAAGWPLPQAMAAGLTLFQATETTKSGQVVELSYSDGLSVTSVFVQRGELPRSMPGWQRLTARGRQVYARDPDDRSLAWSSRGFVYTVISDAPTATIDQVILRLPHDSPAGFWERMGRGLRRIVSWANPFR